MLKKVQEGPRRFRGVEEVEECWRGLKKVEEG